jgi:hypothetical protein
MWSIQAFNWLGIGEAPTAHASSKTGQTDRLRHGVSVVGEGRRGDDGADRKVRLGVEQRVERLSAREPGGRAAGLFFKRCEHADL